MTVTNVEGLIDLLNAKGGAAYFGEPVSILEHSLQAAHSRGVGKGRRCAHRGRPAA